MRNALLLTLLLALAGCSGTADEETAAVVVSVNEDGTLTICSDEPSATGIITYRWGGDVHANLDLVDLEPGDLIRISLEEGTEDQSEPNLSRVVLDLKGEEIEACSR